MSLAINLATRGRPDLLIDTIERTLPNISRRDTQFVISVDDDDTTVIDALRPRYMSKDVGVEVSVLPREDTLGAKYNRILEWDADVYLAMVDYAPHITPGFDQKILDAAAVFPDKIGVVYNWMANLSFPCINAVTKRFAELQGYMYPPYFPYWFVDHWLDDMVRMTGRVAFADVRIDVTKRPGTQEMRAPEFWATYFDVCVLERREVAYRIIDALDQPEWEKALLKRNCPMHEHHSLIVNQIVRDDVKAGRMRGIVGDVPERYRRLEAAAKERAQTILVPELRERAKTEPMPILSV